MPTKIDLMSDEEVELRIALLERQRLRGTTAAPVEAVAATEPAPTVTRVLGRKAKPAIDPKWFSTVKVCPHCGKEKNVGKDFGIIVTRGVQYASSWCAQCRSETSNSYRTKPRKNKSKHNPAPPAAVAAPAPKKRAKKK